MTGLNTLLTRMRESLLARNTFWMFLGHGARIPVQAVYFILIARALGAQGYGSLVAVGALVGILAPFAGIGSGHILVKQVARDPSCFRLYWGKALALTTLSGSALAVVTLLASRFVLPGSIPLAVVVSLALADLVFFRLLDVAAQAYQAFQRLGRTSQLMVLPIVVRLLLLLALLLLEPNPSATLWSYFYLAGGAICAPLAVGLVQWELGRPAFRREVIFSSLREGSYFAVSLSSQNLYNDLDKTLLARLATLDAAGIYGAAYRVVDVSFTPVRSLLYASYARFFQSGAAGIGGSVAFACRLLPFALAYGAAASALLYAAAPLLPHLLGKGFAETVPALRWLSVLPLLKALHYFAADALTGAGFQGARSLCQGATAVLNVALTLWLIPAFSWRGAAWASIATDLALAVAMWLLVLRIRGSQAPAAAVGAGQP